MKKIAILPLISLLFLGASCKQSKPSAAVTDTIEVNTVGPEFNADSAYAYTAAQCNFGPRPMNTPAHEECGQWIIEKFRSMGLKVITQRADLKGYDGTILKSTNIMASYRPEAATRILVCAHWDSRPWADHDPNADNHKKPILAANDAASGVAVMIELARLLSDSTITPPAEGIGVDFVCFDAEDWGYPEWEKDIEDPGNTFALGADYFSRNLPEGYSAQYGVLLDMVGGKNSFFYQELVSKMKAPDIVAKVWSAAHAAGQGKYFPMADGGGVTDDHVPVNDNAHIPTIDIIPYYPDAPSPFGPTWHTLNDNMDNIDRATLKAVGQTMVQVIWSEQ